MSEQSEAVECTCGPSAPYDSHDWDCPLNPQNQIAGLIAEALREAADEIERRYTFDLANLPHIATFYNGGIQDAIGVLRARADAVCHSPT